MRCDFSLDLKSEWGYIVKNRKVGLGSKKERERMNIYVGNLSREITDEDLKQAFEAFGRVESATVIKDKFTGEPRGFGFVEMPASAEAQAAIDGLNGQDLKGNNLSVNEARPREDKRGGKGPRGGGRRF